MQNLKSNDYFKKGVHFIGIGGVSLSGLALLLLDEGIEVSGSDSKSSNFTDSLIEKGVSVYIGHSKNNIKEVSLVVYTAAINLSENEEYIYAKENNIPTLERSKFIGLLMKHFKKSIAISGTHGKTTSTSLITDIMINGNLDPTSLVGGYMPSISGNFKKGISDYLILEACEYKASFLNFSPYIGVILNIDEDHMDFYKDINEIEEAFLSFAKKIPNDGYLIACADDKRALNLSKKISHCNVITYGIENGDILAKDIKFDTFGHSNFNVSIKNNETFNISLNLAGKHNILNSLSSIAIASIFDIPVSIIKDSLKNFEGPAKRFELNGEYNKTKFIDDYAHHPKEIEAALETIKLLPHKKTYGVFQPHTYSRTKALFNEFTTCFNSLDELILLDIYPAREKDTGMVSSKELGDSIRKTGVKCINFTDFLEASKYIKSNINEEDIVLTLGAGDASIVSQNILKGLC